MTFTPEALKKQNELLHTLQKELADQKWVFERFLESPSWRLTSPLRRIASFFRKGGTPHGPVLASKAVLPPPSLEEPVSSDIKATFLSLAAVELESFLASATTITVKASNAPLLSIILVLYNRAELTLGCVRSIIETVDEEFELLVVDNASSDSTPRLLQRIRGARVLRNEENLNFLAAVNQAARECRGQYLLLLNNDAQLLPGSVRNALNTLRSSADIGAVGGKIILLDGTLQEAGSIIWKDGSCIGYGRGDNPLGPAYMFRRDVDYCSGAFLLTPRVTWEEFHGFDEVFKPAYYEETDYCLRLWKNGKRVVYEPDAVVIHYEFASSTSSRDATLLQAAHQQLFEERHRSTLKTHESASLDRLVHGRARHKGRRVLILDDRVPHLWLGSGFPRAHALLMALLRQGCFVTLCPLAEMPEPWDMVYTDIPREVEVMLGMQRSMLPLFIKSREHYYDTIIISRPHNMELAAPCLPGGDSNVKPLVIYDAEALFTFREAGQRRLAGNAMSNEEFRAALALEAGLAAKADRVLSVSAMERNLFIEYGVPQADILGHSIKPEPTPAAFGDRTGLLFVGAIHMETSPNADSLMWFLSEILPRIEEKLGHMQVTVAGVIESRRVRSLAGTTVDVRGHVPDLTELYNTAKLLIAPTRFAAGIPHKVHEAAARGVPVVATSILARQLGWTTRELAIGDTVDDFANRCVEVYTNEAVWQSLRTSALERVRRECSPEAFEKKAAEILGAARPAVQLT